MRGTINSIWLTQVNGTLHPGIIPNMSSWVKDAKTRGFDVVLWTNIKQISPGEIANLKANNINVKDHTLCRESCLYKYFIYFLVLGVKGDRTAFALASDILRMSILELTSDSEYFIYADPNDISFLNLKEQLGLLDEFMRTNIFGFAFPIIQFKTDLHEFRNDVLLALKQKNLAFFRDYLRFYEGRLSLFYKLYFKPITDGDAQDQACKISNQTSFNFFRTKDVGKKMRAVFSVFGDYQNLWPLVCVNYVLKYKRQIAHANTWLPIGDMKEELAREARIFGYVGPKRETTLAPVTPLAAMATSTPEFQGATGFTTEVETEIKKTNSVQYKKGFLLT